MDQKIEEALDRYEKVEPGEEIRKEDLAVVHDFLIRVVAESGMTSLQAIKLVRMTERGSWNEGWNKGYESGTRTAPHFSLGN